MTPEWRHKKGKVQTISTNPTSGLLFAGFFCLERETRLINRRRKSLKWKGSCINSACKHIKIFSSRKQFATENHWFPYSRWHHETQKSVPNVLSPASPPCSVVFFPQGDHMELWQTSKVGSTGKAKSFSLTTWASPPLFSVFLQLHRNSRDVGASPVIKLCEHCNFVLSRWIAGRFCETQPFITALFLERCQSQLNCHSKGISTIPCSPGRHAVIGSVCDSCSSEMRLHNWWPIKPDADN